MQISCLFQLKKSPRIAEILAIRKIFYRVRCVLLGHMTYHYQANPIQNIKQIFIRQPNFRSETQLFTTNLNEIMLNANLFLHNLRILHAQNHLFPDFQSSQSKYTEENIDQQSSKMADIERDIEYRNDTFLTLFLWIVFVANLHFYLKPFSNQNIFKRIHPIAISTVLPIDLQFPKLNPIDSFGYWSLCECLIWKIQNKISKKKKKRQK